MNKLEIFIKNLCGEFNNDNQLKKEFESGKVVHPKARHINNVLLTSYDLPENISKADFRNDNEDLVINYNELKISSKFTPMVYKENNGVYEGESISNFSSETEFTLKERIEDGKMYVSEVFRKNGKITFGFVDPIIYEKKSN